MSVKYRLIKATSSFFCFLPYVLVLFIGRIIGLMYYLVSAKARNRAVQNISNRLALDKKNAKKLALECFLNVGKTFVEILYMPKLHEGNVEKFFQIEGEENLKEALSEGKGVILVTAHLGNWEWLAACLALKGFPLTAIVQKQPDDVYTDLLNEFRTMMGVEVLARKSEQIVRTVKVLKKGRILGFLVDSPVGQEGAYLKFLGKEVRIALGPAFFAEKIQSLIVPAFIKRKAFGHKITILPSVSMLGKDNNAEDKLFIMREILDIAEKEINNNRQEWLWMMKRWDD